MTAEEQEKEKAPGECVGKAECDFKDKSTCRQLQREKKCKWLLAPSKRKTPTGKCLGEAECNGKPRRTCHRMRKQEGKCRWKPAPENEVKVDMTIKNVNFDRMDQSAKDELKQSVAKTIAKAADTDEDAVNITLSKGSVKVSATIDLEEKIAAMEGEADMEGKEVDLVSEMKAIKSEVQSDMQSEAIQKEVLTVATSVEGVKDAAEGDIEVSKPETEIVAESVTVAPA